MLTGKMVRVRFARDHLVPLYLDPRDPEWLGVAEQLLGVFRSRQGATRGEVEAEIDELFGNLPQPLIHHGLAKLLEDRCEFEVEAPLPPDSVRDAAFRAAAQKRKALLEEVGKAFSREEVLRAVAAEMRAEPAQVEASLFADLKSEQRLTQFQDITADRLLERYNVALAQALLLRSTGVEIVIRGETPARFRQIFRAIKFRRLIAEVETPSESEAPVRKSKSAVGTLRAVHLRLDGPLSLFSATQKYGLQLALFLPTLLLCGDFELKASLRWGVERKAKWFHLTSDEGLVTQQAETATYVPPEVGMFVDLFRKRIADWEIDDDAEIISLGKNFWIPDYRLIHRTTGRVVLLDLLGFWRRSSVERHLAMLRGATHPFVLALSDQLRVDEAELEGLPRNVVRFRNMPLPEEVARCAAALFDQESGCHRA